MAENSGVSVLGIQNLIGESSVQNGFLVRIEEGDILQPRLVGYISAELFQTPYLYQLCGESLWYQGLCFFLPPIGGQPYFVIANWKYAGLNWTVSTF